MSSAFDRAASAAERTIVRAFGERVRLSPVGKPGAKARYVVAGADPDRAARDLVGVFSGDPAAARVAGAGANSRDNAEIMTARYEVHFDIRDFVGEPHPAKGDGIKVLDRAGNPKPGWPAFKIAAVEPDRTQAKLVCLLVERGTKDPPPP